jgi:hypothetical protein
MRKSLFLKIMDDLKAANPFFEQKCNAASVMGFSSIHKCIIAIKMLAYGSAADSMDDAYCIAESTVLTTVKEFVGTINNIFGPKFIQPPIENEINHILQVNESRGFPGMIGSIDCMHWEWEKCPIGWHGISRDIKENLL